MSNHTIKDSSGYFRVDKSQQKKQRKLPSLGQAATAFGLLLGLLAIWPRPSYDITDPSDVGNPFSCTLKIKNGLLPLQNVDAFFSFDPHTLEPVMKIAKDGKGPRMGSPIFARPWMGVDEEYDANMSKMLLIRHAGRLRPRMLLDIGYHLPFLPHTFHKLFALHLEDTWDGKTTWVKDTVGHRAD